MNNPTAKVCKKIVKNKKMTSPRFCVRSPASLKTFQHQTLQYLQHSMCLLEVRRKKYLVPDRRIYTHPQRCGSREGLPTTTDTEPLPSFIFDSASYMRASRHTLLLLLRLLRASLHRQRQSAGGVAIFLLLPLVCSAKRKNK